MSRKITHVQCFPSLFKLVSTIFLWHVRHLSFHCFARTSSSCYTCHRDERDGLALLQAAREKANVNHIPTRVHQDWTLHWPLRYFAQLRWPKTMEGGLAVPSPSSPSTPRRIPPQPTDLCPVCLNIRRSSSTIILRNVIGRSDSVPLTCRDVLRRTDVRAQWCADISLK